MPDKNELPVGFIIMEKKRVLAVLANYGHEQLNYLEVVVNNLKSFKKYEVTVVAHSNVPLDDIKGIDEVTLFEKSTGIRSLNDFLVKKKWGKKWSGRMFSFKLLPMTCRKKIDEEAMNYDYFIFSENDQLFKEHHIDNFIRYESILPENRIAGLIQYEEDETGRYYPAYHGDYDWDFNSVERYGNLIFAHFTNVHQASFLISQKQLMKIKENYDFSNFLSSDHYRLMPKTNTDIYQHAGMKKLICISEFEQNLIHHLPNLYIHGDKGRGKLCSDENRMQNALRRMLNKQ